MFVLLKKPAVNNRHYHIPFIPSNLTKVSLLSDSIAHDRYLCHHDSAVSGTKWVIRTRTSNIPTRGGRMELKELKKLLARLSLAGLIASAGVTMAGCSSDSDSGSS